jgi:DNA-binding beta-propeller fold protein YncE
MAALSVYTFSAQRPSEFQKIRSNIMRRESTVVIAVAVLSIVASLLLVDSAQAAPPGPSGYHVVKTIPIGGPGKWDYCVVDTAARRIYVTHGTHVVVLDADSDAVVGDIPDTPGVHGVALAPDLGRGFTSNGKGNSVTIFDLKTLKPTSTVKAGGLNPDAIYYDAGTKHVFVFNGRSNNSTVLDAADGKLLGTIPVGGKPEFAVGDDQGHVYVNVEDKSELLQIDAKKMSVLHRWPLAGCKEPSGLAMDQKNRRLFSVCGNKKMMIVNADTGKVVATPDIGDDPDAAGFDPDTQLVFSSNGESGDLTVIHEDSADKYTVIDNVPTKKYARTMAIDFKTHNIFLPDSDFEATIPKGEEQPPMKPNTFGVLLVSK